MTARALWLTTALMLVFVAEFFAAAWVMGEIADQPPIRVLPWNER